MTNQLIFGAALFLVLASTGCRKDADQCDPPATTTYACAPAPTGSDGCTGGPGFGATTAPDPDKTFPIGCTASLPQCAGAYPSEVQTCSCERVGAADAGLKPTWTCPI